MNIIAFIPARSGSKSIPDKNIKLLGNRPLIVWSIEVAQKCGLRTIVNTDSQQYAKIAKRAGAEVMIRPANLGKDNTSMFDVLKSEIPKIGADVVVLLQPTSPLRKSVHVKTALSFFTENLDRYDSLVSVEKVPEKYSPYAMLVESSGGKRVLFRKLLTLREKLISYFTGKKFAGPGGYPISQRMIRRQDMPQCWLPDGNLYIFKTSNLSEGNMYGKETLLYESEGTPNLNTSEEWARVEEYLKNKV